MKTFKQFLTERRSNPDKNPRSRVVDQIRDAVSKAGGRCFVSFTDVDKIGIRPDSKYNTPLGVYFYPFELVDSVDRVGKLPFASDRPYVQIVRAKDGAKIIDLSTLGESEEKEYYERIFPIFAKAAERSWKPGLKPETRKELADTVREAFDHVVEKASEKALHDTPGGRLWYVTRRVAQTMASGRSSGEIPGSTLRTMAPAQSRAWNKLFRELGVDACESTKESVIHRNEPIQAVFFDPTKFEHVATVRNQNDSVTKFSPDLAKKLFDGGFRLDLQKDLFRHFGEERDEADDGTFRTIIRYWHYGLERALDELDWKPYWKTVGAFENALESAIGQWAYPEDSSKAVKQLVKKRRVAEWLGDILDDYETVMVRTEVEPK